MSKIIKYYNINEQKNNIRCKIYYSDKNNIEKAVIFCTGFAGHKDNNAANRFAEKLLSKEKGSAVVVFNWPAHGDDIKKKLVLNDCTNYLDLVIRDTKRKMNIQRLYSFATSFGGYMVLKYISEHENPFDKITLRCPAVNMYDVLTKSIMKDDEFDMVMKGKNVEVGFDRKVIITRSLLDELHTSDICQRDYLQWADDILILHGTEDEIVPFETVKTFAENNRIKFIPVSGADHRFQNPAHLSLANAHAMEFFSTANA